MVKRLLVLLVMVVCVGCNSYSKKGYVVLKNDKKLEFKNAYIRTLGRQVFIEQKMVQYKVYTQNIKHLHIEDID